MAARKKMTGPAMLSANELMEIFIDHVNRATTADRLDDLANKIEMMNFSAEEEKYCRQRIATMRKRLNN